MLDLVPQNRVNYFLQSCQSVTHNVNYQSGLEICEPVKDLILFESISRINFSKFLKFEFSIGTKELQ